MMRSKRHLKLAFVFAGLILTIIGVHLFYTYVFSSSVVRTHNLDKYAASSLSSVENDRPKHVLFWTSFFNKKHWSMTKETYQEEDLKALKCPHTNCVLTHQKDLLEHPHEYDALVFHGAEAWVLMNLPKTRNPNQNYIMATMEAPGEIKHNLEADHDFYNLTMTYRLDSDIKWAYGGIIDKSTGATIAPAMHPPWRQPDNDFYDEEIFALAAKKNRTAAWFVSHCDVYSRRDELTRGLQKFIDVDVYGKCGTLTCPQDSPKCSEALNTTYKFYLAFENTLCVDYVTEKLFNHIENYVIPVVFSGADVQRFLPPKSYIDANAFETVKDLAEHLTFLSEHPHEYIKYFWWKQHYKVTDGTNFACQICEKLNEFNFSLKKRTYESIKDWFYEGSCNNAKIKF